MVITIGDRVTDDWPNIPGITVLSDTVQVGIIFFAFVFLLGANFDGFLGFLILCLTFLVTWPLCRDTDG